MIPPIFIVKTFFTPNAYESAPAVSSPPRALSGATTFSDARRPAHGRARGTLPEHVEEADDRERREEREQPPTHPLLVPPSDEVAMMMGDCR